MAFGVPNARTFSVELALYSPGAKSCSSWKQIVSKKTTPYRLELLPVVPAYHRRARQKDSLEEGQLVYYGPMPSYYGIGEVKRTAGTFVAVDFRGTGQFGVHEDVFEHQYLIPIPSAALSLL